MPDERASTTARRGNRAWAVGAWAMAISVFAAQVWVLLDPTADSAQAVFPVGLGIHGARQLCR